MCHSRRLDPGLQGPQAAQPWAARFFGGCAVAVLAVAGCGGGGGSSSTQPPTGAELPPAVCGPSTYENVLVVNDLEGPTGRVVSATSPPRCDSALETAFILVFGPSGHDYSNFLFREQYVPGSLVLTCGNQVTLLTRPPKISPAITPPSLTPSHWVDQNGLPVSVSIDELLKPGCTLESKILDQWAFRATTTPDIPAAQAACGGSFDGIWKTFATKVNVWSRTGNVIRSCKTIDGGPVGSCQDFDVAPKVLAPIVFSVPSAGGTYQVSPQIITESFASASTPARFTCRLLRATSQAPYISVTRQSPRKDAKAASEFEVVVAPNAGPARGGSVVVGFDGTTEQAVIRFEQGGAAQPTVCPILAPGAAGVNWLRWHYHSIDTLTCQGSFADLPWGTEIASSLEITQDGCTVEFRGPAPAGYARTQGLIVGNVLTFSAYYRVFPPLPTSPIPVVTEATKEYVGFITSVPNPPAAPIGVQIDMTTHGRFAGTLRKAPGDIPVPGSCETSGVEVWRWQLPLPPLPRQ